MMFSRLGVLNAFLTYGIFTYGGLSGRNSIISQGRSVYNNLFIHSPLSEYLGCF